jgi:uncharacterized membrane protein YkvA (DUF1232 family)
MKLYDWYRSTIRNPKYRWWIILGTITYLVSPLDFLPDFLPIIGQIDDAIIVTLLISEVSQMLLNRVKSTKSKTATAETTTATSDSIDVDSVSAS